MTTSPAEIAGAGIDRPGRYSPVRCGRRAVGVLCAGLIVADGDRRAAAIGGGDEGVALEAGDRADRALDRLLIAAKLGAELALTVDADSRVDGVLPRLFQLALVWCTSAR